MSKFFVIRVIKQGSAVMLYLARNKADGSFYLTDNVYDPAIKYLTYDEAISHIVVSPYKSTTEREILKDVSVLNIVFFHKDNPSPHIIQTIALRDGVLSGVKIFEVD